MLADMNGLALLARMALLLCLVLPAACATSRPVPPQGEAPSAVRTRSLPGGRVHLSFEPLVPNPTLEVMSVEEAQAALTVLHSALLAERPEIRVLPPSRLRLLNEVEGEGWDRHLRERFLSRFGGALLPLPETWQDSRLYQALKL